jgi:GT2 family glycosyltransferase
MPVVVSIIIVTWNNESEIEACLSSLYSGRGGLPEILVVDNASSDRTVGILRGQGNRVRLIENADNRGFAAASNQGLREASGRYRMLLNPDTIVESDALQTLVQFMDSEPSAGAAGARLVRGNGEVQRSCLRFPSVGMLVRGYLFGGGYLPADMSMPSEVSAVSGAALIVRREVVEEVGPFDERFYMYAEETDWCYRMAQAGWKVYYVPDAHIMHIGGASAVQVSVDTYVRRRVYKLMFVKKHRSPLEYRIAEWLVRGNLYWRLWKSAGPARQYFRDVADLYKRELNAAERLYPL